MVWKAKKTDKVTFDVSDDDLRTFGRAATDPQHQAVLSSSPMGSLNVGMGRSNAVVLSASETLSDWSFHRRVWIGLQVAVLRFRFDLSNPP
jgi:hypothetical protein